MVVDCAPPLSRFCVTKLVDYTLHNFIRFYQQPSITSSPVTPLHVIRAVLYDIFPDYKEDYARCLVSALADGLTSVQTPKLSCLDEVVGRNADVMKTVHLLNSLVSVCSLCMGIDGRVCSGEAQDGMEALCDLRCNSVVNNYNIKKMFSPFTTYWMYYRTFLLEKASKLNNINSIHILTRSCSTNSRSLIQSAMSTGKLCVLKMSQFEVSVIDGLIDEIMSYGKLVGLYPHSVKLDRTDLMKLKQLKYLHTLSLIKPDLDWPEEGPEAVCEVICRDNLSALRRFYWQDVYSDIFDVVASSSCPHQVDCVARLLWMWDDGIPFDRVRIMDCDKLSSNLLAAFGVLQAEEVLKEMTAVKQLKNSSHGACVLTGGFTTVNKIQLPIGLGIVLLKGLPKVKITELKIFNYSDVDFNYPQMELICELILAAGLSLYQVIVCGHFSEAQKAQVTRVTGIPTVTKPWF